MCTSDNYVSPYLLRPLRSYEEYLRDQANSAQLEKQTDHKVTSQKPGDKDRRYRIASVAK